MALTGMALLEQRLEKKLTPVEGVGFDPFSIITLVLSLLAGCLPTVGRVRRSPLNVARVWAGLRREGLSWADARRKAEELFDIVDEATNEEIQGFLNECCCKNVVSQPVACDPPTEG